MLVSSKRKPFSAIIHILFYCQWFLLFFSVRSVISYKNFAADTSRNTSFIDRQNWLYSKQLHVAAEMEIHSQEQIAWAEKHLDRHSERCHINGHLWRSSQIPKKKKRDFWPGLKIALILVKKDKEKLKKNFIVKHERILQSKKDITEMWQFIFCLITHLLITQLAMWSLWQEFMLKILWRQEIFSWISNSWSQQYHNTIFIHTKISHHYSIKWYGWTWN